MPSVGDVDHRQLGAIEDLFFCVDRFSQLANLTSAHSNHYNSIRLACLARRACKVSLLVH
jgi:hypothetical protein